MPELKRKSDLTEIELWEKIAISNKKIEKNTAFIKNRIIFSAFLVPILVFLSALGIL